VAVTLVFTHITIAAVTIFLHRYQTHRGLDMHPAPSHFFRFWLWMTTGMVTKEWVAVHRKHHSKVETPEDPHSPQVYGIKRVLWTGAELYQDGVLIPGTLEKFGKGTPDDWLERHIYTPHPLTGVGLMLIIDVALFGVYGITMWAVQMFWIPFFAAGVINGVGHWSGYRNYQSADTSTNMVPWGIIIGGEELHNNHHAFPSSAKFSMKPWEFDIGWVYIRIMERLGLAKVRRVAPQPIRIPEKTGLDLDAVKALVTNRVHVMADYAHNVFRQVYREEMRGTSGSYRKSLKLAKRLLNREDFLLDEQAKLHINQVLESHKSLEVVYQFRRSLQDLWNQRTASYESLLQSLQDWCRQAEASGVESLQRFARSLSGYASQAA
jgi:stearoyl-CoA desaturase (delta-9 desaturase)